MSPDILPSAHPDAWINLLRGYTSTVVNELSRHGITVCRSWLDPGEPRDATILYMPMSTRGGEQHAYALVWDEQTGWRTGQFISGAPGVRTVLNKPIHIGGGLLPSGDEVAWKIASGVIAVPRMLRSYADTRDGFDDVLRNHVNVLA